MPELSEILYQHTQGFSLRQIARSLGISRNTVRKIIQKASELGYRGSDTSIEKLSQITQTLFPLGHSLKPSEQKPAQTSLARYHHQIAKNLELPYMTLRQCLRLLKEQYPLTVSETSFHRYIRCHFPRQSKTMVIPMLTKPGEQAQVDYAYVGLLYCPTQQKARRAYAFIMTLSYSRYRFVYFVFSQDTQTWCDAHRRAFEFFGGVPKVIVLDNLKAGIIKPDCYDPTLNRTYAECEKHYGFIADPAKVRMAKHKGKVERSVTLVKQQIIAGREFPHIQAANEYAAHWCRNMIANEITRTTGETPKARFEKERTALRQLPGAPFDPPLWQPAKVQKDAHVTFQGAFYSLPPGHIDQTVWVRADTRLVHLYNQDNTLLKYHPRATHKGQWQTDWQDIPKERRDYVLQSAEQLISLARHKGEKIAKWVEMVIGTHLSETKKRKVNALLRLAEQYTASRLEAACARAIAYHNFKLKAIERILETGLEKNAIEASEPAPSLPTEGAFLHQPEEFYYQ